MRRLLIRPGAIGDVILSLLALESARADYTEVWAPRVTLPLIRFADRTRAIADTGLDLVGVTTTKCPLLEGFDSIYSWYGTARPDFREAVAHLPFEFSQRNRSRKSLRVSTSRQPPGKSSPLFIPTPAAPKRTGLWQIFKPSPLDSRKSNGASPAASTISTIWAAGSQPHACTSGTIPVSAIWPPPSGLPSLQSSSPPIRASGLRGAISSPSSKIRALTRLSAPVRSTRS